MKINKFIALAAIAVMAVGAMGFIRTKVLAQSVAKPAQSAQVSPSSEDPAVKAPDTDNIQLEEQIGPQNGPDSTGDLNDSARFSNAAPLASSAYTASGAQILTVKSVSAAANPSTASDPAGEAVEPASADGQDPAPAGTPAITADAAVKAAQTHLNSTAAGKATLDDENGKLVYSVDINGSDVKVDAMTGTVLGVDQAGDGQADSGN